MIGAYLRRRREFRARVAREASDLITFLGDYAYHEARQRMREARGRGASAEMKIWSKVAVEIAGRTGYEIGKKGAAKWPDPPPRPDPKRREIADRIVAISQGIGALSAGRADARTLHNIGVAACQILEFSGRAPVIVMAVDEVIAACVAIVPEQTQGALHAGVYPAAAAEAGRALERLKAITMQ